MSKKAKLIDRLLCQPKDFTWDELSALLGQLGFNEIKTGTTAGSRRKFHHPLVGTVISLHKPHPKNVVKPRALADLCETLINCGHIKENSNEQR